MQIRGSSASTNKKMSSTNETVIRVLCVDDELPLLDTTKSILELQDSFQIETATSVDEALQKLSAKEFDVVVSDYQMPVKSGLDFLKILRDAYNDIPFILFTGKGREEVAVKALNLGADRYINKVGHPETVYGELAHSIRQKVDKKSVEKQLRFLSSVIEQSSNAILILDSEEKIVYVNPTLLQFHGLQFKDVVGISWNNLIEEGTPLKKDIQEIRNTVFSQKAGWSKEIFNTINGKAYWIRVRIFPLVDSNDRVTHFVYTGEDITKQKRSEQTIWDREERLRAIIASSPDAMIVTDIHGKVADCNIETMKLLGISSRREIIDQDCYKFIAKENLEKVKETVPKLLEQGAITNIECKLLTKNGSRIDVEFSANTLRDAYGTPVGAVVLARDITERKKVADEIKKSEEKYRGIVELSPDGIVTMNMKGVVTSANKAVLGMTGLSKDEVVGKHFTKIGLFKLRDVPKYVKLVSSILRGNKNQRAEFTYLRKDGTERLGEAYISLLDEKGKQAGLQAILHDITEEKKIQQELQDSEEKYRTISHSAQDSIILLDENGKIIYWNPAAEKTFGYTKEEAMGKELHSFFAPERFYEGYQRGFMKFKKTGQGYAIGKTLELFAKRKDGTEIPIELSLSSLKIKGKRCATGIIRDITERKKTQEVIKQSEKRFKELSQLLPEVIFEYDLKGNITYVNHEAHTRFGYSEKEFENGLNVLQFMAPECVDKAKTNMAKIVNGKRSAEHEEYKLIRKDGSTFPAIITAAPIRKENKIVGIRGVLIDITERKKAQENLIKERDTLEKVTGNLNTTLVMISKDLRILWTNKYLSDILGDTSGKLCHSALNRLDHICPGCKIKEVIETGKQAVFEMTVNNPEGQKWSRGPELFLEITAIPIKDKNGYVTEVLELALDITERKKMETAIREAEEQYRVLIDSANALIMSVDKKGKFMYVNEEWKRVFGYSDEEIKKLNILDTVRNDKKQQCLKDIELVTKGKPVNDIETVSVTKNGKEIFARGNVRPIFSNGKLIGTVGVFLDITEHQKAENNVRETLKKMEKMNEKLGVVGKFTRHDTRNKLATIVNSTYLAKTQIDNKEAALKHLENVDTTIYQIEKILDFSRIYEMLGTQEKTNIDVKTMVDEAFMLASQSQEIELVNECKNLTVKADSLMRQIFYNLIENSAKHGEKVTEIKVSYTDEKDAVNIIYTDNGIGIPENEKEQIFHEGYGKGTGYGLYLIRKICDEYGWAINENGNLGEGVKFIITIPK